MSIKIRDRIKELRRVKASLLRPHPKNWRTHPDPQRDALRDLLGEIGYASALVARELPDGSLELIDGHLRAETTPDAIVPVLVLDVSAAEAAKLLATLDPVSALAESDSGALADLLRNVTTQSTAVHGLLEQLAAQTKAAVNDLTRAPSTVEHAIDETFQVVVECCDEAHQRSVYERMTSEGLRCRLLTL